MISANNEDDFVELTYLQRSKMHIAINRLRVK